MFIRDTRYRRDELHRTWGGSIPVQRQGGILTPREAPLVLIVSGQRGERYGYDDHCDDDGIFHYYGAGQRGDMEFVRGNRAIRDHTADGKTLHLFLENGSALRYWGGLVYTGFDEVEDAPDQLGHPRRAIVFRLVPTDDGIVPAATPEHNEPGQDLRWTMPIADLANLLGEASASPTMDATEQRRRIYRRSVALKILVRRRADGHCEGCGRKAPFLDLRGHPYLEPHHTTRIADGGPDRLDHVIALCPDCHRRVHYGEDGDVYNVELRRRLAVIVAASRA